jgi:hypothetical protein
MAQQDLIVQAAREQCEAYLLLDGYGGTVRYAAIESAERQTRTT